jgi:hypothetical protein
VSGLPRRLPEACRHTARAAAREDRRIERTGRRDGDRPAADAERVNGGAERAYQAGRAAGREKSVVAAAASSRWMAPRSLPTTGRAAPGAA